MQSLAFRLDILTVRMGYLESYDGVPASVRLNETQTEKVTVSLSLTVRIKSADLS